MNKWMEHKIFRTLRLLQLTLEQLEFEFHSDTVISSMNTVKVFYDFLNFFSLAYFIIRVQHI